MALAAFKSIRRLTLYEVQFPTFGHCARLIQAFPHLEHFAYLYLSWKRSPPDSPHPRSPPRTQRRRTTITHLDHWSERIEDSVLEALTDWLLRVQEYRTLRTLSIDVPSNDSVPKLLRCGPFIRSIYLTPRSDNPVHGFENLAHLQTLQIGIEGHIFPIRLVNSIILSTSSQRIRSLTIYLQAKEDDHGDTQQTDVLDLYRQLDDALCSRALKELELTLRLYRANSTEVVSQWRQNLLALLPKFCALQRVRIETIPMVWPDLKWVEHRDGF